MRDFTINMYSRLVDTLKKQKYEIVTMKEFIENKMWNFPGKVCVLRHDIDRKIDNAVVMAELEHKKGVRSTYYVRYIRSVYNVEKLKKIESFGHEIGFHYETLDEAKGDLDEAYKLFVRELNIIRKDFDIKTICMHGYPLNPWRNLDIWKKYNYHNLGIIGEPYLDMDYTKVAYFTDTGRSWGSKARVKDIIPSDNYNDKHNLKARSTPELIDIIKSKNPEKIIILVHPNRWTLEFGDWISELVEQKIKNVGKVFLKKRRY